MNSNVLPLIVILGPTASGKTSYAVRLAQLIDGEIICADSRTVYRGMDVGTAKPTKREQEAVPHWGLDLIDPDQRFTLYDFQQYALDKIEEIRDRGHVPMLVGGSGLYIDSVIYSYRLSPDKPFDKAMRDKLDSMTVNELISYAKKHQIELPVDARNPRRLVRAIEQGGVNKKCSQLLDNTVVIGINADRQALRHRSRWRAEQMLADGLIDETDRLHQQYGDVEPLRRNAYGAVWEYRGGLIDRAELINKMVIADGHLVKKQFTWWRNKKRARGIMWQSLYELERQLDDWREQGEHGRQITNRLMVEYKKFRTTGQAT